MDKLTSEKLFEASDVIMREYNRADFKVTLIHTDNQFKPLVEEAEDEIDIKFDFINPGEREPYIG